METVEEVYLTDEIKAKLKGCLGFQVDAAFKYVQKAFRDSDVPKEMWTVWTVFLGFGVIFFWGRGVVGGGVFGGRCFGRVRGFWWRGRVRRVWRRGL